tara:strand:- start:70 stop:267 length:198 start_codon:yes stop_codon:yes gene_type:complete
MGKSVATINEQNSKDCVIKDGNISIGKIMPTNKDLEKSGTGNNNNPANKPIVIDIYEFFSFSFFE